MYLTILLVFVFLAAWAFNVLREDIRAPRFKALLIVNIDSLEKMEIDDYLPRKRVQMRKTVILSAPLLPGVRVETFRQDYPLKVLEVVVGESLLVAHLEPIRVAELAVENEVVALTKDEWIKV